MQIKQVSLQNFRNYTACEAVLLPKRNVLIGENAQGKTNFLEALEILSSGKAPRTSHDSELIRWSQSRCKAELTYFSHGCDQTLSVEIGITQGVSTKNQRPGKLEKTYKVNGLSQPNSRALTGRLVIVSFKSLDLNLLRGGPKYRRDWIDSLTIKLRPAFQETLHNYQKVIAQRNKLLKTLFEKGKLTVTDQDQLLAWDKQAARYGARIIKERLKILSELLPVAEEHQSRLSRSKEKLTLKYVFRLSESSHSAAGNDDEDSDGEEVAEVSTAALSADQLATMEEIELAKTLLKLLKERRYEELRRKQTLIGPHRDDIVLGLNEADAVSFASQGQQRSIVIALKLAELQMITEALQEPPVLLLDDVLAELDTIRQGLLMAEVDSEMQTIITTTHISDFDPIWVEGARIFNVSEGSLTVVQEGRNQESAVGARLPDYQGITD